MNNILTHPVGELGYNFIDKKDLPNGLDEYHIRNYQNHKAVSFRKITGDEKAILISHGNVCDNWENIRVGERVDVNLIRNCEFYGLNRIEALEPMYKEFHDFRMAVGLYNSIIISCDFGKNCCIDNVRYLSHYILGDDVMVANVNELATTNHAKFGNGILKEGEDEKVRVWVEVCNENGGRAILPFNGMLPGDAYLWTRYRTDKKLQSKFKDFTQNTLDNKRGYYGKIGDRTVIKNTEIIKDVWIGSDCYIKGANKLKNLTINSDEDRTTQIGEGCELVNGIVGFGCRIFYGVKAVRFVLSSHSQLKYGARLINSFLGDNSTISCCEVLNSLIFPGHEQHHNNSFLCAALVSGQSNVAAGATIGSNHNSRAADGEIVAGRGFWPGLCVSLKHNSRFASYTIIAKGDYQHELDIQFPFSLVSISAADGQTQVLPAYWFIYNSYALARNSWKSADRDKRTDKTQHLEFDYLAPDSVNEMFTAIEKLSNFELDKNGCARVTGFENTTRAMLIAKVPEAIKEYRDAIRFYGIREIVDLAKDSRLKSFTDLKSRLHATIARTKWKNVGGQLIREDQLSLALQDIKSGKIASWEMLHNFYQVQSNNYAVEKLNHAYCSLLEIKGITGNQYAEKAFEEDLDFYLGYKKQLAQRIYDSRAKDYKNPYRQMVYDSFEEMNVVVGSLEDNSFIQNTMKELDETVQYVSELRSAFLPEKEPISTTDVLWSLKDGKGVSIVNLKS